MRSHQLAEIGYCAISQTVPQIVARALDLLMCLFSCSQSSVRAPSCTEDMSLLMQLPIFLRDLGGVECDVSDEDEDEDPPDSTMYIPDYVAGKRGKLKAKSTATDRCEYLVRWKNDGDATWEDACAKVCNPCLAALFAIAPPPSASASISSACQHL